MARINILLLDDDEVMTLLFERSLAKSHDFCKVQSFNKAELALDYLANSKRFPDVIFVDYKLPGIDGFDFLLEYEKRYYSENVNTLIFMMSAFDKKDMVKPAKEFPFLEGYLQKPVSPEKIRDIITHYFPKDLLKD